MEQVQQPVKRLIRKYYEDKQLYLKPNSNFLLEDIQRDARLSGLTTRDILILKNTLYELSRLKQYRQKGKQEFRNYITFSPGNYISSIFDHVLRDSISVRLLMMSHPHATSLVIYPFFFFSEGSQLSVDLSFIKNLVSQKRTSVTPATRYTIVVVMVDLFR